MINNIIVFKPPEINDIKSNKTEREIQYADFIKTSSIPAHHFNTFMEMESFDFLNKDVNSTLPAILIKSILSYCIPIIKELPIINIKTKTVNIFKPTGIDERLESEYYNIGIQLEHSKECLFEYDKNIDKKIKLNKIVIPKHETFKIIGVVIPHNINKMRDKSFLNRILELPINDILKAGIFGLVDFQNYRYTQSRLNEITPKRVLNNNNNIYFESETDAKIKIQIINRYFKYIDEFYSKNILMLYRYIWNLPFSRHIDNQYKLFNIFNPEFNKTDEYNVVKNKIPLTIAKLIHCRLGKTEYVNDFMFYTNHIFDQLHQILLLGINADYSKKKIQELDLNRINTEIIVEFNKIKFQKNLEYAKKKSIAYNKFEIDNLSELTTAQLKIVNLDFDKMESYYKSVKTDIDDLKIVNSLIWAIQNGTPNIIKDKIAALAKIIKIPSDLESPTLTMIQNSKKNNLICPHIISKAMQTLKGCKTDIIKSGLIRDHLINKFSMPVTDDGYFCRICGELLAENDADEIMKYISGKRVSFVNEFDKLKIQMWKEISYIITTYIKFKDAVNLKNIITNIINTLRPEMGIIENNLSKIKSNSKDSIHDLMRIYIVIYTFAMIVNMINNNYGKITFANRIISNKDYNKSGGVDEDETSPLIENNYKKDNTAKKDKKAKKDNTSKKDKKDKDGGKNENPKSNQKILQNIINNALVLIIKILNVTINNVSSINIDSVKPILIKAYKWVNTLQVESKQDISNKEIKNDMSFVKTDYIYNYISYVLNLVNFYNSNNKTQNSREYTIKDILGRSWDKIESDFKDNISLYATSIIPDLWNDTLIGKYKYGSFKYLVEYVKNGLYNEYAVPYTQVLDENDKKYEYIKKLETEIYELRKRVHLKPYNKIFLQDNYMKKFNDFNPKNIKIDKYYDNTGKPHKFDIFVYQNANNKGVISGAKYEYNKSDINEWLKKIDVKKTNMFKNLFIVDEKCSVCNVLLSQTKNISIEKSINKLDDINVFFTYFSDRCPKGELHDFVISTTKNKDSCCIKCGITLAIIKSYDKKYYEKYIKIYEKIISEKISLEKLEITNINKIVKSTIVKNKFPAWDINNSPMLELSRKFNIKYNVWINLGLMINKKFNLIESEKINPSISSSHESIILRNIQLYSYYLHIVTLFYMIKNYDRVDNIEYDLKQLMLQNKVRDLNKKLINIDQTILDKYEYYKENTTPIILSNFMLYTISTTIINIHKSMKNAEMQNADNIIKYMINSIMESEKMLSDPDLTKFSKYVVASDNIEIDVYLLATSDVDGDDVQDGYESEVESEKGLEELSDENPDDDFSVGDLDMELDEDGNVINSMDF